MTESNAWNRRDFIRISGGAGAAVLVLGSACGGEDVTVGEFALGPASGFAEGSATLFDEGPFLVLRDADGLYAMSALCTHQSCTVNPGAAELTCPCHGATYDLDGNVTGGPAPAGLDHFELTIDGAGEATVNTGVTVAASTRTPVG